jgi:hypothetical protein
VLLGGWGEYVAAFPTFALTHALPARCPPRPVAEKGHVHRRHFLLRTAGRLSPARSWPRRGEKPHRVAGGDVLAAGGQPEQPVGAGELFLAPAAILGLPYLASAVALNEVQVLIIPAGDSREGLLRVGA